MTDKFLASLAQSVQQTVEILNALTDFAPSFISPFDTSKSTVHVSYPFRPLLAQETTTAALLALNNTNALTIRVPTGSPDHLVFVQWVTLLAMILCAAYVAYTAIHVATSRDLSTATRSLQGHDKRKVE